MKTPQRIAERLTLVRRDEVARIYRVSERTVRNWLSRLEPAGTYRPANGKAVTLYSTADIAALQGGTFHST